MAKHALPSSARTAARSTAAGRANATPAANGTPSPRKARAADRAGPGRPARKGRVFALEPLAGETHDAPRLPSGIAGTRPRHRRRIRARLGAADRRRSRHRQVDAADPGRRRARAQTGHRAVYISGEEAVAQVRLRAERLGLADAPVELAAETSVEDIIATLCEGKTPRLIVIDSIQTMWTDAVESAPGTVTQVRGSAQALIRFAKRSRRGVILVGHVTKDGQIAGPRVVEHMVDAVLSFEGDGAHQFRILRAVKNRFGPTDEIGVFEMTGAGLREVPNPSELFLSERDLGSARHGGVRRHRRHAAAAGRNPGAGRADLARHAAPRGGRLGSEPALDGARGARGALRREARRPRRLSQRRGRPAHPGARRRPRRGRGACLLARRRAACRADAVYFGEVSLSGAVRPVAQAAARLKEAAKLGFTRAFAPEAARGEAGAEVRPRRSAPIGSLADLVADIAATSKRAKSPCGIAATRRVTRADAARYTAALARSCRDSAGFGLRRRLTQARAVDADHAARSDSARR